MKLEKIPTFEEAKDWVNANAYVPNAEHADDSAQLGGDDAETFTKINDSTSAVGGDIYITEEGESDPTQNDGDLLV